MPHPPEILAVATRLRDSCRCDWQADDRNAVIAYLQPQLPVKPADFPLRLDQRGTVWWLEKQRS